MEFIKFEKKHQIGIKEIDNQHKEIFRIISELFESQKKDKKTLLEIFSELLDQLKIHFETEENFMKKHKAIEFISHKLEHDRTFKKYSEYFDSLKRSDTELNTEMLESLKNWLIIHLDKKDSKLQFLIHNN